MIEWEVAEDGYEEQIVIPNEKRELAAGEGIGKEHFDHENWQLLYFDTLRIAYTKQKASIDIYSLLDKMTKISREKNPPNTQGRLF